MALAPGTRVGPYEIVVLIGAGGMGEVYRARDTHLDRDVAIKVLPDAVASDAQRLARFEREARTLAALCHAHIAQIHGLEKSGGQTAIVMELVEGSTLSDRLARGPLSTADAIAMAKQIAEAVESAHELGIVHRDLKPGNVMVRADKTVKVLDFGLAKSHHGAEMVGVTMTADTGAGLVVGTPAYMSPEQARGEPVDRRTDIWAFGCIVFGAHEPRIRRGARWPLPDAQGRRPGRVARWRANRVRPALDRRAHSSCGRAVTVSSSTFPVWRAGTQTPNSEFYAAIELL